MKKYEVYDKKAETGSKRDRFINRYKWIKRVNRELNGRVFDYKVAPYSYWITVKELMKNFRDYDRCTKSSQDVLWSEMNGLIDIVNNIVNYENEDDVQIRVIGGKKDGQVITTKESTAKQMVECEFAAYV